MKNPYRSIKDVRKASKYLANKHGIIKDVLRTIKTLPTLNSHLAWASIEDPKQIKEYEKKIFEFLEAIDVKRLVRDGLYETGEVGTIVLCLRNNTYVQFLELDDLRINKQKNGKWVVEFDLETLARKVPAGGNTYDLVEVIESLPDEVTVKAYNEYKNKGIGKRFVELSNCDVIAIDNNRNFPWGLPFTMGAWSSLIQKEIISRVERSMADRLIKQILILYAGSMNGSSNTKDYKAVPTTTITHYFKELTALLQKKDQANGANASSADTSGTGLIALPDFFNVKSLEIDNTMFTKDIYEKINSDIFMNLGVSEALVYGSGANYSSAQVNNEKIFRYIFAILEQFETIINGYIKLLLPANLSCRFYFDRTTMLDKDVHVDQAKEFYVQTGIFSPWAEALLGIPYAYALTLAEYEQKVLNIQEIIKPPLNAHTSTPDNKGGRPSDKKSGNSNTNKNRTNGGNNSPAPSK